jgi:cytoskeletal protein RodZ
MFNAVVDGAVSFNLRNESFQNRNDSRIPFFEIVFLAVIIFIDVWLIFLLWNNVVTKLISVARPMKSLWYSVGLIALLIITGHGR